MKKHFLLQILIIILFDAAIAQQVEINSLNTSGSTGSEEVKKICTLPAGEKIMAGEYTGMMVIGNDTMNSLAGSRDLFLVKYDVNMEVVWTKSFGNVCNDKLGSIITGPTGTIYVTGSFHNFFSIEGASVISEGGTDIFVASFNSDGILNWLKGFGGTQTDEGTALATTPSGDVIAGGTMMNATFPMSEQQSSGTSAVIARISNNGIVVWSICESATLQGDISLEDLVTDTNGKVYVTGYFFGNILYGNNGTSSVQSALPNAWAASYNSNGTLNYFYSPSPVSGNYNSGTALGIVNDELWVTGYCTGTNNFSGTDILSADRDIFILRLNNTGTPSASSVIQATGMQHPMDIFIDGQQKLVLSGFYIDSFNNPDIQLPVASGADAFILTLNDTSITAATYFGGAGNQYATSLLISNNTLQVAGYFSETISATVNGSGISLASSGENDIFIATASDSNISLSTPETSNSNTINVVAYPNPAIDYVKFLNNEVTITTFTVYDISGKQVMQTELQDEKLDVNQLTPGLYNVIFHENGQKIISRFVKK